MLPALKVEAMKCQAQGCGKWGDGGVVRMSSSNDHPFQVLGQPCVFSCWQMLTLLSPTHLWFTVVCDVGRVIYSKAQTWEKVSGGRSPPFVCNLGAFLEFPRPLAPGRK